jgi:DNA-binding transcriptional ArsR family regulator
MVEALLNLGANPNSVRVTTNGNEYSALSDAIWSVKNTEMVKLLLDAGADQNRVNKLHADEGKPFNKSMLTCAIIDAKSVEMVEALLNLGANPNSVRVYTNGDEYSVLSDAIWNVKNTEMVKLLLDAGADPNRVEILHTEGGKLFVKSMLACAIADAKSTEIVETLLKHGASWDESITIFGITKTVKEYPFDAKYDLSQEFLDFLKSKGWRGSTL